MLNNNVQRAPRRAELPGQDQPDPGVQPLADGIGKLRVIADQCQKVRPHGLEVLELLVRLAFEVQKPEPLFLVRKVFRPHRL
ncbi:MAG: hypothetical protein R6V10_15765, partial [bacterium]